MDSCTAEMPPALHCWAEDSAHRRKVPVQIHLQSFLPKSSTCTASSQHVRVNFILKTFLDLQSSCSAGKSRTVIRVFKINSIGKCLMGRRIVGNERRGKYTRLDVFLLTTPVNQDFSYGTLGADPTWIADWLTGRAYGTAEMWVFGLDFPALEKANPYSN